MAAPADRLHQALSTSTSSVSLERLEAQHILVADGGAVARRNAHAVDAQRTARRHEIGVASGPQRILDRLTRLQPRAEHPRVGADR